MKCSLASALVKGQQMQFLFLDSFKRNISQNRKLYVSFVDLEKAFDRVSQKVLWWALRVGVPAWLAKIVQAIYVGARSRTRLNSSFSEEFEVKVGVHQRSVLSRRLFIIILEALSRECRVGFFFYYFYLLFISH